MGEGSARPKAAADYKLPELPEALKDMPINEGLANAFREKAHKAGFSQGQFEMAVGEFLQMAPTLVNAGMQFNSQDTVKALQETWGADYAKHGAAAWRATEQLASQAGVTLEEIETQLGNIPAFNKIMAVVGMQLKEDTSVNPGGSAGSNGGLAEAAKIQQSEEYRNPRHPGHAAATARWQAIVNGGKAS